MEQQQDPQPQDHQPHPSLTVNKFSRVASQAKNAATWADAGAEKGAGHSFTEREQTDVDVSEWESKWRATWEENRTTFAKDLAGRSKCDSCQLPIPASQEDVKTYPPSCYVRACHDKVVVFDGTHYIPSTDETKSSRFPNDFQTFPGEPKGTRKPKPETVFTGVWKKDWRARYGRFYLYWSVLLFPVVGFFANAIRWFILGSPDILPLCDAEDPFCTDTLRVLLTVDCVGYNWISAQACSGCLVLLTIFVIHFWSRSLIIRHDHITRLKTGGNIMFSYSWSDGFFPRVLERLVTSISSVSTFVDYKEIMAGDNISEVTISAAKNCSVAVVHVSRNYFNSPACLKEWNVFMNRIAGVEKHPMNPEDLFIIGGSNIFGLWGRRIAPCNSSVDVYNLVKDVIKQSNRHAADCSHKDDFQDTCVKGDEYQTQELSYVKRNHRKLTARRLGGFFGPAFQLLTIIVVLAATAIIILRYVYSGTCNADWVHLSLCQEFINEGVGATANFTEEQLLDYALQCKTVSDDFIDIIWGDWRYIKYSMYVAAVCLAFLIFWYGKMHQAAQKGFFRVAPSNWGFSFDKAIRPEEHEPWTSLAHAGFIPSHLREPPEVDDLFCTGKVEALTRESSGRKHDDSTKSIYYLMPDGNLENFKEQFLLTTPGELVSFISRIYSTGFQGREDQYRGLSSYKSLVAAGPLGAAQRVISVMKRKASVDPSSPRQNPDHDDVVVSNVAESPKDVGGVDAVPGTVPEVANEYADSDLEAMEKAL